MVAVLLSQANTPSVTDPRILLTGLYLVGALLAGALVIALLQRWRRQEGSETIDASQQLSHYRQLYEQGALSEEEFRKLRGLLGEQLRPPRAGPEAPGPTKPPVPDPGTGGPDAPPPADPSQGIRPA